MGGHREHAQLGTGKLVSDPVFLTLVGPFGVHWNSMDDVSFPRSLLNERQVAKITGMSPASVRRWRRLNQGPKWHRVGLAAIRYKHEDVSAWLESRPTGGGGK